MGKKKNPNTAPLESTILTIDSFCLQLVWEGAGGRKVSCFQPGQFPVSHILQTPLPAQGRQHQHAAPFL